MVLLAHADSLSCCFYSCFSHVILSGLAEGTQPLPYRKPELHLAACKVCAAKGQRSRLWLSFSVQKPRAPLREGLWALVIPRLDTIYLSHLDIKRTTNAPLPQKLNQSLVVIEFFKRDRSQLSMLLKTVSHTQCKQSYSQHIRSEKTFIKALIWHLLFHLMEDYR